MLFVLLLIFYLLMLKLIKLIFFYINKLMKKWPKHKFKKFQIETSKNRTSIKLWWLLKMESHFISLKFNLWNIWHHLGANLKDGANKMFLKTKFVFKIGENGCIITNERTWVDLSRKNALWINPHYHTPPSYM